MPTHVLIVEGDAALSKRIRTALEHRGHTVEETSDGRGLVDLVRERTPGVVVLAVELPAGQNGYLLVGKLKKDEALKSIPVILIGNPEGFGAHARLKNRADDYLAKPLDIMGLLSAVARLSGSVEETPLVLEEEATVSGDPDLDLIDAAFDDSPAPAPSPPARSPPARAPLRAVEAPPEDDFSGLSAEDEGTTMVQLATTPLPDGSPSSELHETGGEPGAPDLGAGSDDDQARAFAAEVEAAQRQLTDAPADEPDELVRVRSELHAAVQLVGDLRDQHAQAEQRELELKSELARREGQLKTLQTRLDQVVQEKRRLEQALQGRREDEGEDGRRAMEEQLAAAQRDLELNRAHVEGAERQIQQLQERAEAAESELSQLRQVHEGGASPDEVEALRARISELEEETRKNRDRVTRLYARLKTEERAREKARKAVAVAGQLLSEQGAGPVEAVPGESPLDEDEPAVA